MSDMTSLASKYSESAQFAKDIDNSVLVLKRIFLGDSVSQPTQEEEAQARKNLSTFVSELVSILDKKSFGFQSIPESVVAKLIEKNQNKLPWFINQIKQIQNLLTDKSPLGNEEFSSLDEVCDVADSIASASHRRLWRR